MRQIFDRKQKHTVAYIGVYYVFLLKDMHTRNLTSEAFLLIASEYSDSSSKSCSESRLNSFDSVGSGRVDEPELDPDSVKISSMLSISRSS